MSEPLDLDALEALHRSVYEFGIVGDYQEYDDALHGAASALFAAARERDRLAGELERERANMDATMKGWDALCESSDKTEDELAAARAEVQTGATERTRALETKVKDLEADLPWRCFQCGGVFTRAEEAKEHFGSNPCVAQQTRTEVEKMREAAAKIADLTVEEFTDRRDDQLRDFHPTAALTHARQAQTAADIAAAIRSLPIAGTST